MNPSIDSSPEKQKLLQLLEIAHRKACHRNNLSTEVLLATFEGNGECLRSSIIAALSSVGGRHAPIKESYDLIARIYSGENVKYILPVIVPGFGSSFYKKESDPLLDDLGEWMNDQWPDYYRVGVKIRNELSTRGLDLYPNLAFYTACAALIMDVPFEFCEKYLIQFRLKEWITILQYGKKEIEPRALRETTDDDGE